MEKDVQTGKAGKKRVIEMFSQTAFADRLVSLMNKPEFNE